MAKKTKKAKPSGRLQGAAVFDIDHELASHDDKQRKIREATNYDDPTGTYEWTLYHYDHNGNEKSIEVPASVMARNVSDGSVRFITTDGTVYWYSGPPSRYVARIVSDKPVNAGGVAMKVDRVPVPGPSRPLFDSE